MLEKLVRRADIMIVNFPPPARERLKLRWEDIEPLNPRLVYCSLTGYGETGPDRDRPGFDITAYFGRSGILDRRATRAARRACRCPRKAIAPRR